MKKKALLPIVLFLCACAGAWAQTDTRWGDLGNGTYANPVLLADYSDPDVIRVGKKYYMTCSEFHFMGMPVLESDDMVNWRIVGQIYSRIDQEKFDTMSGYADGTWAPALRFHDGKFWMFVCMPNTGLYMSTAAKPEGPWTPLYHVKEVRGWEDPCPFWDDDGKAYLGHSVLGAGPIILHRMSPDGKQLLDDGQKIYEGPVAEGTKFLKRNGYYYLSIPEGGVSTGWQMVLRSKNIYGPYEGRRCLEMGSTNVNGPHQGAVVDTPDGQWWFYHFQSHSPQGRVLHLQPVVWQPDGFPLIGQDYDGNGVGEPVKVWTKPAMGKRSKPSAPQASDRFRRQSLSPQWAWNHNPVDSCWSLKERKVWLTLRAMKADEIRKARNCLTQKIMGYTGEATVKLDNSAMTVGQRAGMVSLGRVRYAAGVEATADGTKHLYVERDGKATLLDAVPDKGKGILYLRLTIDDVKNTHRFSYSLNGKDFTPIGDEFPEHDADWKGYRVGLFTYATEHPGGTAWFTDFSYLFDGPGQKRKAVGWPVFLIGALIVCVFFARHTLKTHLFGDSKLKSRHLNRTAGALIACLLIPTSVWADDIQGKLQELPVFDELASTRTPFDWLIHPERSEAGVYRTADGQSIVLANAMVWRTLRLVPNLATTDLVNRMTGERMLRFVEAEGSLTIDGKRYLIGGLKGQEERGYLLDEWIERMQPADSAFQLTGFEVRDLEPTIQWKRSRWVLNDKDATGKEVVFTLKGSGPTEDITVRLSVCIYDRLPVMRKSFIVENGSSHTITIEAFEAERLNLFEPDSPVESYAEMASYMLPNMHVETDFACGGFRADQSGISVKWLKDRNYTSQRNYSLNTPCVLQVTAPVGPDQRIGPGGTFSSMHVWEMLFDSYDRERKGLFTRRFYSQVAPWSTENPIFLHLTSTDPAVVRRAVDQCAECGYEMIIISFGSGLNMEDISEENVQRFKALVDYAHSKGIEMGCYSLLASRRVSEEVDCINPTTGKTGGMRFGNSPCLSTTWGEEYFHKLKQFMHRTGMTCLEHDGSYPGDVCASTEHAFHRGLADSQWTQYQRIASFYHELAAEGIYTNVPDFYIMNGTTKSGIGYRETNWSLPRERQIIHARQLNFDCTWDRPSGYLWSFIPLVQYHGGGAAATLEPLSEHLYEYRMHMVQNYGAGVQACYRGPRLYDTDETREMVQEVIAWYKKYRRILNSDIIHLRKPDARDWDGMMHVSPWEKEKALALLYNPLNEDITRQVTLPLYYTGLVGKARIREKEGKPRTCKLDKDGNVTLTVQIPARGYTWFIVE